MSKFDYARPADLFTISQSDRRRMRFRRYDSAAHAVRYAVEEIHAKALIGSVLQVEDERLDHKDIRRLYDDPDYPLARKGEDAA